MPTSAHAAVSALWNGAYDLGMGVGAVAVGALAARTCYGVAFLLVAAAMLPALALACPMTDTAPVPASLNT